MTARAGYFLATQNQPRVRRARDVVRVVAGVLFLIVGAAEIVRIGGLQESIQEVAANLPDWAEVAFWVGYGSAAVYGVLILVATIVRTRANPGAARDVLLATILSVGFAALLMYWQGGVWPRLLPEFGMADPVEQFPMVRVAAVTAIVLAVSPHVTRTLRRFGSFMIVLVAVSGFGLGFGVPTNAIAAIGVGMIAAGTVLFAFGSPNGFPKTDIVAGALHQLGVAVTELDPAADQSWGTRRLIGFDADGTAIEVKAYGRDASDTQLAAKVWRTLWYRDTGPDITFTRLQAVEHEALMAMFAARAGVNVAEPLTAGLAGDDVAIIATPLAGLALRDLDPSAVSDADLVELWRDLGRMHDRDMAHGFTNTDAVRITTNGYVLHEFAMASLAAGDRVHVDIAELLFSLAVLLGVDRAVATALEGCGDERLGAALPYLQLPAISRAARRDVEEPKDVMKELQAAVKEATGVEPPEPVQLKRVSVGSLVTVALMLLAANMLFTQLAGIDYAAVWDVLRNATWIGIAVAFVIGQTSFLAEARAMEAAVGRPLPLRALAILQLSARFIGLAVPSAAGRVAMNMAFLVKFGVSRAAALTQGVIDGLAGFAVEAGILALALLLSDGSFNLGLDVNWERILLIAVIVVVIGVVLTLSLERFRRVVLPAVKDALGSVSSVFKEPRRALGLLGYNFLARLAFGTTLWLILKSLGIGGVGIAAALTVTIATNLLAGLVPIPGGVGVAEAVMASWLVIVGVPEAPALAATVVFRMLTFYIPAVEGLFAMRWLEKRDYL